MVRIRRKLCEIKVYEMNTSTRFYRAECEGLSVPSRTIKGCVDNLLKELRKLEWIK